MHLAFIDNRPLFLLDSLTKIESLFLTLGTFPQPIEIYLMVNLEKETERIECEIVDMSQGSTGLGIRGI